jgi:hypothetical protein
MSSFHPAPGYPRVRIVRSFEDLLATPFAAGVNALCWPRDLPGDFGEVLGQLPPGDGIRGIDEAELAALTLGPAGSLARDTLLEDLRRLREAERDPVLNRIDAYPRDEEPGPVATDVMSFHADSAPVEADTWLCTYHGACSEGLRNEEARLKIELPAIRTALLADFGGDDDDAFAEYLADGCYDLHYAPLPGARPFAFGTGHLWRIAVDWPGSPVPPCVHRAPDTSPGDPPRLLLIC